MIDKTDDAIANINDFLRSATDKINANIILVVALFNGFLIGLVTTGYLGASSIPVKSATFGLIIWQFIVVCFLTARYVNYTTTYLAKFIICGSTGYYWQWQIFAMIWPSDNFIPPFGHDGFGYIVITSAVILHQCFKGNEMKKGSMYSLYKDKDAA